MHAERASTAALAAAVHARAWRRRLRPTARPAREAFPPACGGVDLPDFCVSDDTRVPVMAAAGASAEEVQAQISALETKLAHLRGEAGVERK